LEDPDVDGRIILKWIFDRFDRGIDWIDLAQDRDRWRAVVNTAMKLRVP
jgi:transposase